GQHDDCNNACEDDEVNHLEDRRIHLAQKMQRHRADEANENNGGECNLDHQQAPKTAVWHRRKIGKMGAQHEDAGRIEQDNHDRHELPGASDDPGLDFHHDLFRQASMQGLEDHDLEDHHPTEGDGAEKMDRQDDKVVLVREGAHDHPPPSLIPRCALASGLIISGVQLVVASVSVASVKKQYTEYLLLR